MENANCMFNMDKKCKVLAVTNCLSHCRFAKTAEEFYSDQVKAADSLRDRGLRAVIKMTAAGKIMSVEREYNREGAI